MSDFVQPIVQAEGKLYRLVEDYRYEWQHFFTFAIQIPAGFVWNGASVPRGFWTISGVRPGGPFLAASLIHDAFYRNAGLLPDGWYSRLSATCGWVTERGCWTRGKVDWLFRDMMREAGIHWWQYHRAYWAVRLFGWWAWKAKK